MQQVRDLMQEVFTCSTSTGQMSCQLGAKYNTEPSPTLEVLLLFGCGRQGAGGTEGNPGEPCRASCSLFRPGALHLRCCLHPERDGTGCGLTHSAPTTGLSGTVLPGPMSHVAAKVAVLCWSQAICPLTSLQFCRNQHFSLHKWPFPI